MDNINKILVVEDVPAQQKLIQRYLAIKGYRSILADSGREAIEKAKQHRPNVIILDLYLPDIDGIKVCEALRSNRATCAIPIIMVTARGGVSDIINGLKAGADDYVCKPYNYQELLARIEAVSRRYEPSIINDGIIKNNSLRILINERKITIGNKQIDSVTRKEFDLLSLLVTKSPQILSTRSLLDSVWGDGAADNYHTLDTHIYNLRKKLGRTTGRKIVSVYGFGYKYE
ncbi:MAG: hypothetical protein A2219_04685 [Elusimicrobia bacterium RIFOXYA2_FULL_50_26]|nr:MAG: hypothetical protein A2219_04685 [Elusimicrobia bacterium RIFOXYA2_FULL_50_26]OGS23706.1 MAG: hypothetical protein A2314_01235 [Elusimicrobia bacterium RIFOXYB2_FULL_50_12]